MVVITYRSSSHGFTLSAFETVEAAQAFALELVKNKVDFEIKFR